MVDIRGIAVLIGPEDHIKGTIGAAQDFGQHAARQ
jgi:hypothetical protein